MDNTAIVFEVDTLYRDTGRVVTNKVIVKADGSFEAEGRIRSLNIDKLREQSAKSYYQSKSDSLALELDKTKAELSRKETVKVVEKKVTVLPWWFWLLIIPGFALWIYEKHIRVRR